MKRAILSLLVLGGISMAVAEDLRVACLGNSITVGVGGHRDDPDAYPAQLDVLMGPGVNVQNFGVSGRTLLKHGDYPIWNERAFTELLAFKPDLVTICLGTNDSKPWNWEHKDEFVPDYACLIDTFRALDSHPAIYACLPTPSFSDSYDIRDSILAADILPMIRRVVERKGVDTVDFRTPLMDQGARFPDGIHPDKDGWWLMARILFGKLTGREVREIADVNLALNAGVITPKSSAFPGDLVDGDLSTFWPCRAGESVVVDLGGMHPVDLFHVHFAEPAAYRYTIETSADNSAWDSASDQSARRDAVQAAVDRVEPRDLRYVRFTLVAAGEGRDAARLAELCVLASAPVHAPVLSCEIDRSTLSDTRFRLVILSASPGGYLKYYTKNSADAPYTASTGYRLLEEKILSVTVKPGVSKFFYAKCFNGGYEAASDSLRLDFSPTAVDDENPVLSGLFELEQNFPNPFNPETRISFTLARGSHVSLGVFDLQGRRVAALAEKTLPAGRHSVQWRGRDDTDDPAPSGLYFVKLRAGGGESTRKMLMVR